MFVVYSQATWTNAEYSKFSLELLKNAIQSEGVITIYKEQLDILPRRYDEESDFC